MADLQNFSITPGAAASVTVPTATFAGQFTDSQTGALIADLTGPNAVQWPAVRAALSPEQNARLDATVAQTVMQMRAGLPT